MLHAFNQKNVRRVLATSGHEHSNDKNEDAITSMIFSPLSFMTAESALEVLVGIVGDELERAVEGRLPTAHNPQLWPAGLKARAWSGGLLTRCEPDVMVSFQFPSGDPIFVIGEMKWGWSIAAKDLSTEIMRQHKAVARKHPNAKNVVFSVTKEPMSNEIPGLQQRTWRDVSNVAERLRSSSPDSPAGRWGALVFDFLSLAEQLTFHGFNGAELPVITPKPTYFWDAPNG